MHKRSSYCRVAVALSVLFAVAGCAGIVGRFVLPQEGVRDQQYEISVQRNLGFHASDGVLLVSDLYRPRTTGRMPTILVRIPFSSTFRNRLAADIIGEFWASRGYNVVVQGTRGRYKSGGEFYPLVHERKDGAETLAWLSRQTWFDGRLGMWGGSAFGHTQWAISDYEQPGPSALFVQIASTSFRQMFYPGNAFSLESALFWAARSRGAVDVEPDFKQLERGFAGFPLVEADDRSIGDVRFFDDWVRRKDDAAYWESIDGRERARTLKAPVLLMAGWYDPFLPTQLRDYESVRREAAPKVADATRLIVGPWSHADPVTFPDGNSAENYRAASLAPSLPWFDHHLRGVPLDAALIPPVRIFVMGENKWRHEQEWPLMRARPTAFYLHGDGHANSAAGDGRLSLIPGSPARMDRFDYDPLDPVPTRGGAMLGPRAGIAQQADVEARADVLVYSTPALEREMEVTGPIRAILYVATSAPSTDFTVKLVDVHPDGRVFNVSDGILRRSYDERRTTTPSEIEIELWPTSMLFKAGHKIRIEVSSSNYPRYDRNPNTGRDIAMETQPRIARQTVFHGADTPSRIILPLIPR